MSGLLTTFVMVFIIFACVSLVRGAFRRNSPPACPRCATPTRPRANFCAHCGRRL